MISASGQTRSRLTFALVVAVVLLAPACTSGAAQPPPTVKSSPRVTPQRSLSPSQPSSDATAPDEPSLQRAAWVKDDRAMTYLQTVQKIADAHGGTGAAGTPGYDASV